MPRRVLITGGSGFIGSHIARALAARGDQVHLFDLAPPRAEAQWLLRDHTDRLTTSTGEVDDWSQLLSAARQFQPDALIHTAAIGDPAAVQYRPMLSLRVNLIGSLNALELTRLLKIPRVVLLSSIGALPGVRYEPIDASHPTVCASEGPGSGFYGASKVAVEAYAWGYRQSFDVDFIVLRPSAVYGFGMRHPIFIKPMVENAVLGKPTHFATGRRFPRDYTHVHDVAAQAVAAIDAPASALRDRIFYAATGQPLRTAGEVAGIVRELVPSAEIHIGDGMSDADQLELRYRGRLDVQPAIAQLGYRPRFAELRDGIAQYLDEFRAYQQEQAHG